ncbi:MAG: MFS transporter [Terriglobia bacterium]
MPDDLTVERENSATGVYSWAVVVMLWAVCFLNYADRQAIFSLFPPLRHEFHLNDHQLGMLGASFMWVYAVSGPFAGWLCDRISRKRIILGALLFWSGITACTAIAHTYTALIFVRALSGLGEAFYFPASMSILASYHGAQTRSRAMSIHQSGVYAGSIAGGALAALIAQSHGWRISFTAFGGCGIILALVLIVCLKEPERLPSEKAAAADGTAKLWPNIGEVLSNRYAFLLIAVFIGANFVAAVFLTWLPAFLYRKFHMSLARAGFDASVYLQIASVFGVIAGGILADNLVRKIGGGRIRTQGLGLLLGTPFLYFIGISGSNLLVLCSLAGYGFFKGMYDSNLFAALYDVVPARLRGISAGLMNSLGWLGAGFAPLALAAVGSKLGMSAAIAGTSIIYLALGTTMFTVARKSSV